MAGRKSTAAMELAIGATMIAGVIILIVMLMAWGNSSSILGRHYRLVVNMANVGGLKEGAPVKMGGFQIGRVASIQIQHGGTDMEIVLDIDENRLLPRGSTAKVSTAGLVGDAFMEIIPGKSTDMIKRSATVADADRLESSPLPDISELFAKVDAFGNQLTILTTNLNDVVGDANFRKSLKSMAVNIDAMAYQANLILQRGQSVVDNIDLASRNVAKLSDTLKASVDKITSDVSGITDTARGIADTAKAAIGSVSDTVASAKSTVENINAGVTDARAAINNTLGSKKFASELTGAIGNINAVTSLIARRNDSLDRLVTNLDGLVDDLHVVSGNVKEITEGLDPKTVTNTLNSLSGAITSMTEVVDRIKREPVLALSVNKAADRIVKMKFDEMKKQQGVQSAEAAMREINRWMRESMEQGQLADPSFSPEARPYLMESEDAPPAPVPGTEQRPYMMDN